VLSWPTIGVVFVGTLIGCIAGILPGIGGPVTLVILLPVVFKIGDPVMGFALMLGAHAVLNTGASASAILLGVPGDNAAQALLMDGTPMARKGQAGRALGAAFSASAMGGLFGAVIFAGSIPVVTALLHVFGSPELLMLSLWGLSAVAVLSAGAPLKGIAMAALGLLLSTVGLDPQRAIPRYTFGDPYLWDGLSLIALSLGIFAAPVAVELIQKRTLFTTDAVAPKVSDVGAGIRDTFRHWGLLLRNSALGTFLGIIPGIGGTVIDWLAYGSTVQLAKDRQNFGKGDVRGVIGPDSASNSKEGGALIPTIAFGVPGSGGMAIMLGAFLGLGLTPGRAMLTEHKELLFAFVWILAISNVTATLLLLSIAKHLAKVTLVRPSILASFVFTFTVLGAFMAYQDTMDLVLLAGFSALGCIMYQYNWPRPPLLLGFVLGRVLERYVFLSFNAYGAAWMLRPSVIILAILIALSMFSLYRRDKRDEHTGIEQESAK
jgi:putative tricarboxylic transport membrane protein